MPRVQFLFEGDAFGDGSGGDKFLMDITEKLSQHYGRLVRQSCVTVIDDVRIRMVNPNVGVQDQALAVSGKLVYYEPTAHRKRAWKTAFQAWLANRKALGVKNRGNDFRVGLSDGYNSDVGMLNDGVKFNAWINQEEDPLMLASTSENQDIFGNYSANNQFTGVDITHANFGHWAQKDAASIDDELDFVTNESSYFNDGEASKDAAVVPFQLGFGSWFDDANSDPADFVGVSNSEHLSGPYRPMCGLVGVYIDTTTVDDSETQTQEWAIEISMNVRKWTPLLGSPKSKKRSRKGRK